VEARAGSELEGRVVTEIVEPVLGFRPERNDTSLLELGANSMHLMQMVARAEGLFDISPSLDDLEALFDDASVTGLATMIERLRG
jgi:acyl carrier protein